LLEGTAEVVRGHVRDRRPRLQVQIFADVSINVPKDGVEADSNGLIRLACRCMRAVPQQQGHRHGNCKRVSNKPLNVQFCPFR
jgi:hypothetical protein